MSREFLSLGFFFFFFFFFNDSHREREREREAETQAEGEAGSMHREPDVGFDSGSPGSHPGPKAGAKPLRHPGIPFFIFIFLMKITELPLRLISKVWGVYPVLLIYSSSLMPI